jgi:uncharacterized protein
VFFSAEENTENTESTENTENTEKKLSQINPMTAALTLLLVLLLLGALLASLTIFLMAQAILRPPRMNDGKAMYCLHRLSPGDLGLGFENESFRVRDTQTGRMLHIAGWWIPHPEAHGRCAILIHGYADAKVGAIAWAPIFHEIGWNVLAIDLRAHGESDGMYSTGGYFERDDLTQVIDELRASRPMETQRMVLFGISMGAAVAAAVTASRDDVAGVILESPFGDFRQAVRAHFDWLGLPGGAIARAALWFAEILSGARFDQVRTIDTITRIDCPVLAIFGGKDELLGEGDVLAFQKAIRRGRVVIVPNAMHLMAMQMDAEAYESAIAGFLGRDLKTAVFD